MLKKIGIAVVAVLVLLAGVIATRPAGYRVVRTATVNAPPAVAYAQVADFHNWAAWSPWGKLDPAMKTSFSGPAQGPGAAYAWTGNDKVGEGRMTVTAAQPNQQVEIKLEFLKPFAATSETAFTFVPRGAATEVTWAMDGHNNFMAKAASMVMDMDKMIGSDFDRGLANLKSVAEAQAGAAAAAPAAPAGATPAAAAPSAGAAGTTPAPAAIPAVAK